MHQDRVAGIATAIGERLSYQIDRHRRSAIHCEPGRGCAGPSMRAAARTPHCQLRTCYTHVSASEATAEAWMLPSNRNNVVLPAAAGPTI
jgi:hypothetical protein